MTRLLFYISISIHAPSRERRASALSANYNLGISIHAPSRERLRFHKFLLPVLLFQSTLPRGSDLSLIVKGWKPRNFNPRSLAGATKNLLRFLRFRTFQSTLPRGSDMFYHQTRQDTSEPFQSTLPRGSDLLNFIKRPKTTNFNPRSLAGATKRKRTQYRCYPYFNPRSLAGATIAKRPKPLQRRNFNPRSLAGATYCSVAGSCAPTEYFNPRSLAGATVRQQNLQCR